MSPHRVWNVEGAGEGPLKHAAVVCCQATAGTRSEDASASSLDCRHTVEGRCSSLDWHARSEPVALFLAHSTWVCCSCVGTRSLRRCHDLVPQLTGTQ